ncbi:hypothetical protein [Xenorhabdus siamensis]|uniref:hypothetical protein n=1 Tax=Xenorhabdus siamensis TaxID=3136254 RepID=UPI0030F3EBF3
MKELTTIELGQVSGAGSVINKGDLLKETIEYKNGIIDDILHFFDREWPIIPPYLEPVCDN